MGSKWHIWKNYGMLVENGIIKLIFDNEGRCCTILRVKTGMPVAEPKFITLSHSIAVGCWKVGVINGDTFTE